MRMEYAGAKNQMETLPLKWIARRVHLGTSKSANSKLHQWVRANEDEGAKLPLATRKD